MRTYDLTPEDLRFNPPRFDKTVLSAYARSTFGKEGKLKPLSGERDQNHRLTTSDGAKYVLKVSGVDEDAAVVDFQVKALTHIANIAPELNVPRIVPTLDRTPIGILADDAGHRHQVRLLTYVSGVSYWDEPVPSLPVIKKIGAFQGKLCKALESCAHPASQRFMPWDTNNGLVLNLSLSNDKFGDVRRLVVPMLDHFEHSVLPAMKALRHQVIHNDGHRGNLLKSAPGADDFVGVIDFGDIVQAPLANDLAVSLDSLMGWADNPIDVATALLSGFHEQFPLERGEIELLYDLTLLRGALTLQLFDFQLRHEETATETIKKEYPDVVNGFERNLSLDRENFSRSIAEACGMT
ncbi:MAG: phosphotransferase [Gammaproteobacteria bacterium]|nr:phosphotransferase [Gammaproteobacteria bacterium]MDH3466707.1 phosphotransferase [Gammaproteobacteria bacterium]